MFRPVTMRRMRAVVLERDERVVLRELGRLGVLQLTRTVAGPDTAPLSPRDRSQEMARCDRLRARVEELRQSLGTPVFVKDFNPPQMTLPRAEEKLRLMDEQADVRLKHRLGLLHTLSESSAVGERLSSYRGLDIPLDEADRFSFLHFVTGSLPAENLGTLQQAIGDNVALLPLLERSGRQPLIAMTTRQGQAALESVLEQAGFQPESLPAVEGATVDTLAEASQHEQKEVAAELEELQAGLQALAAEFARPLAEIEWLANTERRLCEAEEYFPRTEAAVLLVGWVPADRSPTLEERLQQITDGRCVIETTAPRDSDEEQIPVLLRHPRWLRPFEMLVSAYGLPRYEELEPTFFVALSYALMFGMMFGDVGHGVILAVGGLIALGLGRTEMVRDMGLLILFAATSSIVFGIIYGSCFGLESFKKYAFWHDPLAGDPIALMYGAIGIGIVMISLGLILNIINRFRRGDVIGGFLDKFGVVGVFFYWGMLALITKYAAIESRGLVSVAIVLFLVLPLVGWALKEPIEYFARRQAGHPIEPGGGLFAAITESLVGAFEAVLSYLANTISFVRLAAYAMSHAALLVAAFMMADAVRHFSIGGGVLSVLVIILGNLVAIVLEGIIASVQALRLEYYEFFGKFFSGSGQPFRPFRLVGNGLTWKGAPS
jgi:V/A-type H+/Na+-transporting ATPase subunit I